MQAPAALLACSVLAAGAAAAGDGPLLLPQPTVAALAQEVSGETAKRHLEFISRKHRMRGSREFREAAQHLAAQLRAYGLADVQIEAFPADGRIFYGTQRSRPPWDAEFAELWELRETGGAWAPHLRLADWDAMPLSLAQDSESADVTADLIDAGTGTSEADYAGREVRGKIVLVSAQPEAAAELAVGKFGAVGLISYAQNQKTAWSGDDDNLVRWGHLDAFAGFKTFAFMVSLKQARALQARLAKGERIRMRAQVRAGQHPGAYDVVTATIPGADRALKADAIVFSCHLDHPRPGANDNASGCATLLEVARTIAKLIREARIPRPARTLRFVFPPEIEGTLALLNARPKLAARIKAAVHLDMVGGGPATKAIFHVTRGPASQPSFVNDVAEHFGEFVNAQSARFAGGQSAEHSLHAPEGGKEALLAQMADFSLGSDHVVYADSSWAIPVIYLNDWPDRYIHTNFDTAANVDPTKLRRAAFIAAASGYFLASARAADAPAIAGLLRAQALRRTARMLERRQGLPADEAANLTRFHLWHEAAVQASAAQFYAIPASVEAESVQFLRALEALTGTPAAPMAAAGDGGLVFRRNPAVKGPLSAFGYDYFEDRYGKDRAQQLKLASFEGSRGGAGDYAFGILNLVDGRRTVQQIRDDVAAIHGPVPLEIVLEYLRALESIQVIRQ